MKKRQIFKDERTQVQFDRDGFVKIELLKDTDIVALKEIHQKYFPEVDSRFHSSSYLNDFNLKCEISNTVLSVIKPRLHAHFTNFRILGSAFLTKGSGPDSEMPMHQDWTIVDESKYVAVNVWTPLCHTTERNGTLELLKGSHLWNRSLRAPTLPFFFDGYQELIKSRLSIMPVQSTEAVIINQATIHYSKPNLSSKPRVAITTGLVSEIAPLIFHYWCKEKPEWVEVFSQEDDFLLKFDDFHNDIFRRPTMGKSLGFTEFTPHQPKGEEVYNFLGLSPSKKNKLTFDFLKRLFSK